MSFGDKEHFVVRPIVEDDLSFMRAMCYLAAFPSDSNLPSEEAYQEIAKTEPWIQDFIENWGKPGDTGFIATDEAGKPLGAAWYRHYDDEGIGSILPPYELSIGVTPEAQGKKIGQSLLRSLINHAVAEGISSLGLRVEKNNLPAKKLYEKLGFRVLGTYEDSYDIMMAATSSTAD